MMQISIEILDIAGIYYAMMLRNHPHLPEAVTNAIPRYQTNNEDGAVELLSRNLIDQMYANRESRTTLFAGPEPVTLQGHTAPWSLSARLEVGIS